MPASRAAQRAIKSTAILAAALLPSGCGVTNAGLRLLDLGGDPAPSVARAAPPDGASVPGASIRLSTGWSGSR